MKKRRKIKIRKEYIADEKYASTLTEEEKIRYLYELHLKILKDNNLI